MVVGGPYHILAKPGEVAEKVIAVGDPARVNQVAELLKDPKPVNLHRGFPVYTGDYEGLRVSVACHGIGGPSSAIAFEELRMLGAKTIVRLGTAGGLLPEMEPGELVIPDAVACLTTYGVLATYAPGVHLPLAPNYEVLEALVQEARRQKLSFRIGAVVSNDAFYAESHEFARMWAERGVIAIEMECAALFGVSRLRGFKSAAVLILSNNVVRETPILTAEKLGESVRKGAKLILEAFKRIE
ncbi:MAG: purine-nucleoside phosphorylase [Thaumarchaeota archaeon]|nr:purine-nucleoside phosphorylase [Nitrososphaerota archaeon]